MAKAKKDGRPTTLREGRERCAKTIKKNLGRAKFSPSLTRYTLRDAHAESDKNYGQESDPLFSLSFIVRSLLILLSGLEWTGVDRAAFSLSAMQHTTSGTRGKRLLL